MQRAEIRHGNIERGFVKMKTRKKTAAWFIFTAFLALTVFLMPGRGLESRAASYYWATVSKPIQTEYATDSASMSWALDYEAAYSATKTAGYNIYLGTSYGAVTLIGKTAGTSYRFTGLEDGTKYYVKVEPYDVYGNTGGWNTSTVETMPKQVKNLKQARWYYSFRLLDVEWGKVGTADKIVASLYNGRGKKVSEEMLSGSATGTSFRNLKDEVYTVKVQAFRTVNGRIWQSEAASIRCFNQARVSYAKVSRKKKLTVCWKKVTGASGYDVYVSTHPKTGYKKVASVGRTKNKVTLSRFKGKKFRPGKTYYVYIDTKVKTGKKISRSARLYYWGTDSTSYGTF